MASRIDTESTSPMRLSVKLDSDGAELSDFDVRDGAMSILSPDGNTLAFVGSTADRRERQLYVRDLGQLNARPLSGTEDAHSPFFSPEGRWLAFFTNDALKKVALTGGAPLTVAEHSNARGGAWGPDGTIVFTPNNITPLYRVPASGGTAVELTELAEGERSHRWPWFLPNGKAVLFISQKSNGPYDDGNIAAVILDTGERKLLHRGGTFPRYLRSGHLLFLRQSTLFAIPFDADRLETTGEPTPVLEGVRSADINGSGQYALSTGGRLVYTSGGSLGSSRTVARADRAGSLTLLAAEPADFLDPRFSPDETRVALAIGEAASANVHVFDLRRGTMSRLTFEGTLNLSPVWSPDGEWIAFSSNQHGMNRNVYRMRSDGAGQPERLTTSENLQVPDSFFPDGNLLIYRELSSKNRWDIVVLSLEDEKDSTPLVATPAAEIDAAVSPDGRWIAYASDDSGVPQIYVQPFPAGGGKYLVSANGGRFPRWTKRGRELVYVQPPGRWVAVSVSPDGEAFRSEKPELLFEGAFSGTGPFPHYDVSADGERFIVFPRPEQEELDEALVTFVFDFQDEVRRLTGE